MIEAVTTAAPASRLAGLLHRLARRPRLALLLLCLTLWTPGLFALPPLDRDESRFAQSSKQMLESGNFVDIRFGAMPRYKKPVGIYWLQAAATAAAGFGQRNHIWTYRLPSLMGAVAAVWLVFWCARAFASAETAFLAAALLGTTLLLAAEATIATTDAVLLACVLGAQGFLLRVYMAARTGEAAVSRKLALAGWAAFAAGILIKGPVVIAVCVLTFLALAVWDRDWRWLGRTRPLLGLAVTLALVLPWFAAIWLQSHGQFYQQSLGQDFATKLQGGQESHGAPPGYFLLLANLTFWPATLFLLPGLLDAIRKRAEPAIRFLLVWAGACWVMFELVPTKLPHYVLPVYPALAMLAAAWVLGAQEDKSRWARVLFYAAAAQFALGAAVLAAAAIIVPGLYGDGATWWLILLVLAVSVFSLGALIAFLRRAHLAAAASAFAAVVVFYPTLTLGVAPRLDQLWVSPRAAAAAMALAKPGDPPPALAGYVEPSLVFLLGTETRQTDGRGAAGAGAAQGGLALVEDSERSSFMAHLAELDADAEQVGSVSGFNYSRGRRVHIRIYRVAPVREEVSPPAE
ncbi:MAG: glycosyltransferase family 39 protein [Alphaproteobacteria bacterium]|nr:glycosyltransferase family 39 protein [Alphaproteobacteria bacterium]MDE2631255.1 glycosyltransferase family 39 protein [Alphaproteobacteria bacterium]